MYVCVRVPQCLLFLGVVRYSQDLLQTLETGDLLPAAGERELEIRGCSIWAVEVIHSDGGRGWDHGIVPQIVASGVRVYAITIDKTFYTVLLQLFCCCN